MTKVLFQGSFDPFTKGHEYVVSEILKAFDEVVIAVMKNSKKGNGFFTFDERKALIEEIYKSNKRVHIISAGEKDAAVRIAKQNGCIAMVRGLRNSEDFVMEQTNAKRSRIIDDSFLTIAIFTDSETDVISSSFVKAMFSCGESIEALVHPCVKVAMESKNKF